MSDDQLALLLTQRERLERAHNAASIILRAFPRLSNGLTPDAVRDSPDYKTAKVEYNAAFQCLRGFNQQYAVILRRATTPA